MQKWQQMQQMQKWQQMMMMANQNNQSQSKSQTQSQSQSHKQMIIGQLEENVSFLEKLERPTRTSYNDSMLG